MLLHEKERIKVSVTSPHLAKKLLITSSFIFVDVIFAFKFGCMDFAILDFICVLASLNYWRNPLYDWRRSCDIIISVPLSFYHIFCAYTELQYFQKNICLTAAAACVIMYLFGVNASNKKLGQKLHSSLHILGVSSNVYLYYYLSVSRNELNS